MLGAFTTLDDSFIGSSLSRFLFLLDQFACHCAPGPKPNVEELLNTGIQPERQMTSFPSNVKTETATYAKDEPKKTKEDGGRL